MNKRTSLPTSAAIKLELDLMRYCGPNKNCTVQEYQDKMASYFATQLAECIDDDIVNSILNDPTIIGKLSD